MRVLLDTECWLWMETEPERLRPEARFLLERPETRLFLSAASAWELGVLVAAGRLELPGPAEEIVPAWLRGSEIETLPVTAGHALRAAALPPHHDDPVDRLLVAQAQAEDLALLTADRAFAPYGIEKLWAVAPVGGGSGGA